MSFSNDEQKEFGFDYEKELPPLKSFSLQWLANYWNCSLQHVFNLVASGELGAGAVDLRNIKASRSMIRLPRKSVLEFLAKRQNLSEVAETVGTGENDGRLTRQPKGAAKP